MGSQRSKIGAAALISAVSVTGVIGQRLHLRYKSDMRDTHAAIEDADTEVVETTFGDVQYRTVGEGVPVLVSHGIVGGFDQAIQTAKHLLSTDAQLIGVSRFGYLDSELPENPTPENQARAYAKLLDELEID